VFGSGERFIARIKAGFVGLVTLAALGVGVLLLYTLALIPLTPDVSQAFKGSTEQPTLLLASDGSTLTAYRRVNRSWATLDRIAPPVVEALIATEDHRFHEHHGIDVRRTLASIVHTLRGDTQGGSTVTQQLARNLYPEQMGRSRSVTRKLKEMITAIKLERAYTKPQILELYLNTVPFLYNAHGVEMAARTYFDKTAKELTVLESATLVGMLKGTYYYNPRIHPERARERRNVVLAQMEKRGVLDAAEAAKLKQRPLKLDFNPPAEALGPAPHFAFQIRNWLNEWADERGYDLYTDGLRVHTTIDARLQKLANQAVERQLAMLQAVAAVEWASSKGGVRATDARHYVGLAKRVQPFDYFWQSRADLLDQFIAGTDAYRNAVAAGESEEAALARLRADGAFLKKLQEEKTRLQAGFVAIEPLSGAVRAWVGSRDFAADQYDHVNAAQRQPGSTFKPFVYGAALERGIAGRHGFPDVAVEIPMPDGKVWRPSDARKPTGEEVPMRDGLIYSKNNITAQVINEVGAERVASLAHKMGVRGSKLTPVPSLALGTSPVTLLEMVSAYATIADQGRYKAPWMIWRITDRDGNVLEEFGRESEVAMSEQNAVELIDMLRAAIDEGTGRGLRARFGIDADVAGKTGTTQSNADGWFILMHPQLVAGAWVGFNDPRVHMRSGYWGQGGNNALLIVGDFFQRSFKAKLLNEDAEFPRPRGENPLRDWWEDLGRRIRKWGGEAEEAPEEPVRRRAPVEDRSPPPDESIYRDMEEARRGVEDGLRRIEEMSAAIRRALGGGQHEESY